MATPLVIGLSLALSLVAGIIVQLEATEEPDAEPVERVRKTLSKRSADSSGLVREPYCRRVLERIFNKPFPKIRPDFLRNPEPDKNGRHHNLELDGYCEELQIAFEHNGKHHYTFDGPNTFVPTYEDFKKLVQRDTHKVDECRRLGIVLVVILDEDKVKFDDIEKEIVKQLIKNGCKLPKHFGGREREEKATVPKVTKRRKKEEKKE